MNSNLEIAVDFLGLAPTELLDGVEGLELRPVDAGSGRVVYAIGQDAKQSTVTLVADESGELGSAHFSGPDAVQLAFDLTTVLPYVPAAMRAKVTGPAAFDVPWFPIEPLSDTVDRLPAAFARRRFAGPPRTPGVEGWKIDDAGGRDACVQLLVDERWSVGCASFDGTAARDFALELARLVRYFPIELAAEAVTSCTDSHSRARAVAAIGLVCSLGGVGRDIEAAALIRRAATDPAPDVRGMAVIFGFLTEDDG